MKNALIWGSLVLSATALTFSLLIFNTKKEIVYVDSVKLITNYKGSKVAKESYEKKVAVWKANMDTLTAEFNRDLAKYKKEKQGMTAREKQLFEELLTSKQQQVENYRQATADNASKEDKQISGRVFNEINDFLKEYGERHGYEFIMAATNVGNIVYAKEGNDITDEVLEKLNAEYQTVRK